MYVNENEQKATYMRKTTTISYLGSQEDKARITLLSTITEVPVGELVRDAIHIVYGKWLNRIDQLSPNELKSSFFAERGTLTQTDDVQSTEK